MIYLHKILPVLLLPTGLSLMLVVAGLWSRRRALCWAGVGVLWISSTPLVGDIAMRAVEGWSERAPLEAVVPGRAIIVLSSSLNTPPGDPLTSEWTSGTVNRFEAGVELFQAGKAPLLVFTGGWVPWAPAARPVGAVLAERARALGVPPTDMVVTGKVANTAQEARAVAALLRDDAVRSAADTLKPAILVTSAFHMRRARWLFERAGVPVVAFPVDYQVSTNRRFTVLDLVPDAEALRQTDRALRELYGYMYYVLMRRG